VFEHELSLIRLACDPDYATFTEPELCRRLAAIRLVDGPAAPRDPPYRPGDRVRVRTAGGELAATVRDLVADPDGRAVYVVEPDAGTPFPRLVIAGPDLAPLDPAGIPHAVTPGEVVGERRG